MIKPAQFTQILTNLVLLQQRSKMWNLTESLTLKKLTEKLHVCQLRTWDWCTFV